MIEFQNIHKSYGVTPVLHGIDLDVAHGELVILIGPSGCGKSTLLRLVNRMVEPTAGTILVNGVNSTNLDPVVLRRRMGYVIQSIGLFPHMNVLENIEVVPSILGITKSTRRARAQELLAMVGLDPGQFALRFPRQLSGGQQQRVGIARALAANPDVLLMDEPFGAIDPIARERLQDEFLRLKTQIQKTILFVTHDIDEAIKLGDRICILDAGCVQQFDTPELLLRAPKNDFVAAFLGDDRELKRLSRLTVGRFMRVVAPTAIQAESQSISIHSSARDALSRLLGLAGKDLLVTNETGLVVGCVNLTDFGHLT